MVKVERQYLDSMDEDTALEIAFEEEAISNLVDRNTIQVTSYQVHPGFRAEMRLFDPNAKVLTKQEKKMLKKKQKMEKNAAKKQNVVESKQ